jgi:hypothetical protein
MQKIAVAKRKLEEIVTEFAKEGCERDSHDFCTHPRIPPSISCHGGSEVSLVASSASLVSMTSSLDDDDDEYLP